MKNRSGLFLIVVCALVFASCASTPKGTGFDAAKFPAWVQEEGIWRSVVAASFKKGIANAPTKAQVETIMNLVQKTPTSGGANDFFFLVLTDPAQQKDVVGDRNASDGTVTVMIFTDRVLAEKDAFIVLDPEGTFKFPQTAKVLPYPANARGNKNVPFAPDRGYISAGTAAGYINLAAISQGFGTHMFLTPNGYYDNRPYVPRYVDAAKPHIESVYLKGKGYRYFVDGDYGASRTGNPAGSFFEAYGNLRFALAVVIGTVDEAADSQLTAKTYPKNWDFAK